MSKLLEWASTAYAAPKNISGYTTPTGVGKDFPTALQDLLGWLIVIAGTIFVVVFIIGGIQYLTSSGDQEASGKAKKMLIDAVIGMVIVGIAWLASTWILGLFGIETLWVLK